MALGVLAVHGSEVEYDEIVEAAGPRKLVTAAQDSEFDLEHLRKRGWVTTGGNLKRKYHD